MKKVRGLTASIALFVVAVRASPPAIFRIVEA